MRWKKTTHTYLKDATVTDTVAGCQFSYYTSEELRKLAPVCITNPVSRDPVRTIARCMSLCLLLSRCLLRRAVG